MIDQTKIIENFKNHGIEVVVVENKELAKEAVLAIIPKGSAVMTMTSVTLDQIGIAEAVNTSGDFKSVKNDLASMDRKSESRQMQMLGAAPEFAIGSVNAMTEDGSLIWASNTGSQIPAYAYGADKVVLVVGKQKLVKNLEYGLKRINEYVLPLESERARKAYGVPGSRVSKIFIMSNEVRPGRVHVVLVNEDLGF